VSVVCFQVEVSETS